MSIQTITETETAILGHDLPRLDAAADTTTTLCRLTIAVPALNEAEHIVPTVTDILSAAHEILDAFEIILVNDGSTDRTGELMNALAKDHPEIQVVHNQKCRGVGWTFQEGINRSRFDSLTLVPGDNAYSLKGLKQLFRAVGTAELVISYRANQGQTRGRFRILLSHLYRQIFGILFGYKLKDIHSMVVYPVRVMRELDLQLDGYLYGTETLIKLLNQNILCKEVPVYLNTEEDGSSRSLSLNTLQSVVTMLAHLFWSLRIKPIFELAANALRLLWRTS